MLQTLHSLFRIHMEKMITPVFPMWSLEHIHKIGFIFLIRWGQKHSLMGVSPILHCEWEMCSCLFPPCLKTVGDSLNALLLSWLCTCGTAVGGATPLASTLPQPHGASAPLCVTA